MSTKAARLEYLQAVAQLGAACRKFDQAIAQIAGEPATSPVPSAAALEMLAEMGPRKPVRRAVTRASSPSSRRAAAASADSRG